MSTKSLAQTQVRFQIDRIFFALALFTYAATRLMDLAGYPIYFFADEAAQTLLANDLIRNHWMGSDGSFLPTYFYNGYQYNLGLSVYLQVIPALLFERSVVVTRAVPALVSILAPLCAGLVVHRVLKLRHAWFTVWLVSVTPAWFLHSRTAFETVIAVSFYALALYGYLEYVSRGRALALYGAAAAGALAFYSYNPARVVVVITALALFLSDLSFHRRHWRQTFGAGLIVLTAALPFLRFEINHPGASLQHLAQLESFLVQNISPGEKISLLVQNYAAGLSPLYWFAPDQDMARHVMPGFGNLLRGSWPLLIFGLWLAVKKIRFSPYRGILIALIAAPSGAALVGVGITRVLFLVIPAALLCGIAASAVLDWLEKKVAAPAARYVTATAACLGVGFNLWLVYAALVYGPLWQPQYGMDGLQWGGQQVAGVIRSQLRENPDRQILFTSTWANGADTLARYYLGDPLPVTMGNVDTMLNDYRPELQDALIMMTPEEYEMALSHPKIAIVQVEEMLLYPNGRPGFYFCTLKYDRAVEQQFEAEKAARKILQKTTVEIDGRMVEVHHSYLDMGSVDMLFDGDEQTLIRTWEANPLQVQLDFLNPVQMQKIRLKVGGEAIHIQILMDAVDGRQITRLEQDLPAVDQPRSQEFVFAPAEVGRIEVRVENKNQDEPAHVHLWEIDYQ